MNKNVRTILIVGAVAVAAYFAWRWWQNRQLEQGNTSPISQLGTNLNSLAPELVGGSSGPTSGPQVTMPLNITLTETGGKPQSSSATPMVDASSPPDNPLTNVVGSASPSDAPDNPESASL